MRKSSRLPPSKRPASHTINQSSGAGLPKEPNALLGTTNTGKVKLTRAQPSKKKPIADIQDELNIRQQILETNKLRQVLNDLGIVTKTILRTAKTAKNKRAVGGSQAVDYAQGRNKEVDVMRKDINEVLKALETALMSLDGGALPPTSFDLENSKAALAEINAHYIDFQNSVGIPAPTAVQEQGMPEAQVGKTQSEGSVENPPSASAIQLDDVGGNGAPNGRETDGESGFVAKPNVPKTARVKTSGKIPSKVGSKRSRASGDEVDTSHKKMKKVLVDFDDSMSDLTLDESDDPLPGDTGKAFGAPLDPQDESPSAPQPATDTPQVIIAATPAQGNMGSEGPGMAGSMAITRGSCTSANPGDQGTPSIPTNCSAANEANDGTGSKVVEHVPSELSNEAAHMLTDQLAEKADERVDRNDVDKVDVHAVDKMLDETGNAMAGEGDDDAPDKAMDVDQYEVTSDEDGDEAMDAEDEWEGLGKGDESVTEEAEDEETPGTIQDADETTDHNEDFDEDHSDTSDSEDAPETSGSNKAFAASKRPAVHQDKMRLVAATDIEALFKHITDQKATTKKEDVEGRLVKKKSKTAQRVTMRMKWDALSEDEKQDREDTAISQVRDFLRDPDTYRVPVKTRAMIREIAEFCVPACQTTRELALHVLENKYNNLFCIFHQKLDKAGKVHDRAGGAFSVTGTPFSRMANEKWKKTSPAHAPIERRHGYLHCGCTEDEALLEFYWWKLAEATSPTTDETEGWLDHRKMDPRTRTLMFGFFTAWTHTEVDDIYVGYPLRSTFDARMTRYNTKIARLQEAKAEEVRDEARRVKREEAKRIEEDMKAAAKEAARKKEKRNKRRHAI